MPSGFGLVQFDFKPFLDRVSPVVDRVQRDPGLWTRGSDDAGQLCAALEVYDEIGQAQNQPETAFWRLINKVAIELLGWFNENNDLNHPVHKARESISGFLTMIMRFIDEHVDKVLGQLAPGAPHPLLEQYGHLSTVKNPTIAYGRLMSFIADIDKFTDDQFAVMKDYWGYKTLSLKTALDSTASFLAMALNHFTNVTLGPLLAEKIERHARNLGRYKLTD